MAASENLKVYLETSFVSYLTGGMTSNAKIASDQAFTRQWWESERPSCQCFISVFTLAEARDGRADAVDCRIAAMREIPLLDVDRDKVTALARKLIDGHALPEGETTDALHIAAAAVAGMDVLLTWNCRHMANPHTLPKTRQIVTNAGYVCPAVMTPKTFIENSQMEEPYA